MRREIQSSEGEIPASEKQQGSTFVSLALFSQLLGYP
jgi:hypothetical protein